MRKGTENIIGKGFDRHPENINRKGQPVSKPLKDYLAELENNDNQIEIPLSACEIKGDMVIIKLPTKGNLAAMLIRNARKDVRWFQEWAKITGEYAAEKKDINLNTIPVIVFQNASGDEIDSPFV